jgi:AcrR family transcriptional regulator
MTHGPDLPAPRTGQLTRDDWVAAARAVLIARGISAVGVRALAAAMHVTSGAFYWQFRNLEDLHQALRADWADRNTAPFGRAIAAAGPEGLRQYLAWVRVLVAEDEFDPGYDNAIRDWAHRSPETAALLAQVEDFRIAQLRGVFEALGFQGPQADIRARVSYYHQVGYNAMRVREPHAQRLRNVPYYAEILTDSRALAHLDTADAVQRVLDGGSL